MRKNIKNIQTKLCKLEDETNPYTRSVSLIISVRIRICMKTFSLIVD